MQGTLDRLGRAADHAAAGSTSPGARAGAVPARLRRGPCSRAPGAADPQCRRRRCCRCSPCWRWCCCCGARPARAAICWTGTRWPSPVVAIAWVGRPRACGSRRAPRSRGAGHGRVGLRASVASLVVAAALLVAVPITIPTCRAAPPRRASAARHSVGALPDRHGPGLARCGASAPSPTRARHASSNVHDKVLLHGRPAPRRGAGCGMVTLDRYDGQEWLPGNDTMPGHHRRRLPAAGHRASTTRRAGPARSGSRVTVTKVLRAAPGCPRSGSLTVAAVRLRRPARRSATRCATTWPPRRRVLPTGRRAARPLRVHRGRCPTTGSTPTMPRWPEPGLQPVEGAQPVDAFLPQVLDAVRSRRCSKVFVLAGVPARAAAATATVPRPARSSTKPGHDLDRARRRASCSRRTPVGDDEQYAAAMALLANRVGVPARVVVGAVAAARAARSVARTCTPGWSCASPTAAGGRCPPTSS